jgi:pimeloyl-ACP methyl ester carboxylesterase
VRQRLGEKPSWRWKNVVNAAATIDVPVLVLAGEHDQVEPPDILREHLLPYVRHARFDVIPKSGHLLPLEAPDAVATALEYFLTRLGR